MARNKEFNPDKALQSAVELFRRQGYTATSMQNLVDTMGIGRGSMYSTFGGKRELFLTALTRYANNAKEFICKPLETSPNPLQVIRGIMENALIAHNSPDARCGCLIGNTGIEMALHDEDIAAVIATSLLEVEDAMTVALKRAQNFGTFSKERDPRATARYLMCSMHGLNFMIKSHPNPDAISDMVEQILKVLD